MIDERHEELAALHAFDLLEGTEKIAFEAALLRDPALQALVRELRESSVALAHVAPAALPPPQLKARLLAEIESRAAPAKSNKVVAFPTWIPWAVAACFALAVAWSGQLLLTSRSEAEALRNERTLADAAVKNAQNQLEAERIIARQQLASINNQVTDSTRQLADARRAADDLQARLADSALKLAANERLLAEITQRANTDQTQLALNTRLLDETRSRVAELDQRLKTQADLANVIITTLASKLNNSPDALAVAVWDPASQSGVLKFEKLPALAPDKDYQLWVVDPQYPDPVDGGVFTVDPRTGTGRVQFKGKQPLKAIKAYAITAERKGGVEKSAGPFLLLGQEP